MDNQANSVGHVFRKVALAAALILSATAGVKADSVTPLTLLEGPAAGGDSVVLVKSDPSATWVSTPNDYWLHVAATGSYSTNHLQAFTFDANPGFTRTGTLTVDGTTITVTQLGATYAPTTAAPALLTRAGASLALAVDAAGNLFFGSGSMIEKWTAATNAVSTIVSSGSGIRTNAGMTIDSAGNLYIADPLANKVLIWTAATSTLSDLVTGLSAPHSVAFDPAGNLYIADDYAIWKRPAAGGRLTRAFATGNSSGMAFDAKGDLYISYNDGQVGRQEYIQKGTPGNLNPVTVNLGQVVSPYGLAIDPWGNLLISDIGSGYPDGSNAIRQWNAATAPTMNTEIITNVSPSRIAVDNQGTIFLSDYIDGTLTSSLRAKPRAFVNRQGAIVPLAGGVGSVQAVQPATTYLTGPFAPTADQPWITIGSSSNGVINFTATATGSTRYSYITVLGQKVLVQQGTPAAPSVSTPTSANVTVISATLGGNVTAEGGSPVVARGVIFARTADDPNPQMGDFGLTTLSDTAPGLGVFTVNATGLQSNTSYSYRAYATTAYGGTSYTAPATFITQTATPAILAPPTVTTLGNDTATLNGNITDGGNTTVSARGLVYAITSQNGNPEIGGANVIVINDAAGGPGTFSAALSGLAYSTGYSFKVFATNIAGTTYSSVTRFTTLDPTYTLGTSNVIDGAAAGADTVVLGVTPPTAPWIASSNASWLHLDANNSSGTGSALVTFSIDANTGATRTGTLTIAGLTLTVTQAPNGYAAVNGVTQLGAKWPGGAVGVAVDGNGNVFTNPSNGQLVKWDPTTNAFSNVASTSFTNALATDAAGNVYLTNPYAIGGTILKWTAPSGPVTTVASNVRSSYGVAVDSKGNLWATTQSDGLKKATPSGAVTFIQPTGRAPGGVAIDAADNVYWIDNDTSGYGPYYLRVYKLDSNTGNVSLLIPAGTVEYSTGLAVDGSGNLWIMNYDFGAVYKWTAATNTLVPVLTGFGIQGSTNSPGIAADHAGNVYIADNVNTRLVELPRVFGRSTDINVGVTAGSAALPMVIPSTALAMAPFTPTAESAWLHITSNTGGNVSYSWDASATARYGYLNIGGQRILVQQGTPSKPTVTAPVSTGIMPTAVTLGGNVTADGGAPILARGIVLALASDNSNPQIGGTGVVVLSDAAATLGTFSEAATGLSVNTAYTFAAYATNSAGTSYSNVATFTSSAFDTSFFIYVGAQINASTLQPDGKTVFAEGNSLLRYNTDDSQDYLFYFNVDNSINALLSLGDGSLIVAGGFSTITDGHVGTPTARSNIARINASPAIDTFAPNVNGTIRCLALQRDGSILIGGDFTQVNGTARNRIARLYANGTLDLTFNPNANGPVRTVIEQADGKILVGGDFTLVGTTLCNRIARVSTLGVVDTPFVASADASVNVIALQPDNSILVGGNFTTINNVAHASLARLNPNGTLDNSFNATANGPVNSIVLQADGKILLGGGFTSVAGTARLGFARVLGGGAVDAINADVIGFDTASSQAKTGIVNSVMLREDGKIIIGGDFTSVGGVPMTYVPRLVNDPVVQTLAPTGSTSVEWLRGGTLPEAIDVAFDLSTDGGNTWTFLGNGTRVDGGWSLDGLPTLPASAQLRGRARTVGGLSDGSMGWNIVEAPYSLSAANIVVEQPVNTPLTSGSTIDVGTLGLNVPVLTTFTLRNSGGFSLTGVNVTISGANAAMFSVTDTPDATINSLDSTTFTVQAKITSSGAKAATLTIHSNDADTGSFVVNLTATGATSVLPVVTTTAATTVSYTTATVNGTVDAKGSARDVFFDYGLTTTYTDTAAGSPATTSTSGNVSAALTGLLPHTTYHFRARAAGDLGNATGVDKTFITLNNAPVANADSAVVLPGATASIDVLSNDTDADGDALTITTTAPVSPLTAGTVAITANQLVFTAKDTFTGTATVNYTIKDGFGGTATATLTITAGGTPTLTTSQALPLDAAAISYPLTITTVGSWSVSESLAWASVSQTKGTGTTIIQISVQANATTAQRSGDIKIGGVIHHVVQNGVVKPSFDPITGSPFNAIVGGSFQLTLPIKGAPVTYTTTGLPPGLTLSNTTNMITGRPTMAGSTATNYTVVVKASNAAGPLATDTAGKAAATLTFVIHVDPLPAGAVGAFSGYIDRSPTARFTTDANLGARFDMTTTAVGTVSGSVTEGATKKSFTGGQIIAVLGTPNTYSLTVALTGTPLYLDVSFDTDHNKASGVLRDVTGLNSASLYAWRNIWSPAKATIYKAEHSFRLQNGSATDGPQGYGFGSFIVTESTGALVITGKLADGSAITTSTFVGPVGDVVLYQALYSNHGSCLGAMTIGTGNAAPAYNTVAGTLTWSKPASPATAKDTVYGAGFPLLSLDVAGGAFFPPAKGGLLVAFVNQADNAQLDMGTAGADTPSSPFLRISNPNTTNGTTNVATFSATNPDHAAMPVLTFGTGLFSGSFTLAGTPARPAPFFGQIVPISGAYQGYGYYLLPSVPGMGQTVATSPKLSGTVWLISH